MTTIKATCPTCGEVSLTPDDVELRVDVDSGTASYYAFTCPSCSWEVRKPADERIVRLLESGGVVALPIGPPRRGSAAGAPTLTHDDLLDFHALLERDDWFDRLLESVR